MKVLSCEKCGSNDLKYLGGVWICNSCGTKYIPDAEEKKAVDDAAAFKNLLERAQMAEKTENKKAFRLAKQLVEMEPTSSEAWLCYMKSAGTDYSMKTDELITEIEYAGNKALEYSEGTDVFEKTRFEVYNYWIDAGCECLKYTSRHTICSTNADYCISVSERGRNIVKKVNPKIVLEDSEYGHKLLERYSEFCDLLRKDYENFKSYKESLYDVFLAKYEFSNKMYAIKAFNLACGRTPDLQWDEVHQIEEEFEQKRQHRPQNAGSEDLTEEQIKKNEEYEKSFAAFMSSIKTRDDLRYLSYDELKEYAQSLVSEYRHYHFGIDTIYFTPQQDDYVKDLLGSVHRLILKKAAIRIALWIIIPTLLFVLGCYLPSFWVIIISFGLYVLAYFIIKTYRADRKWYKSYVEEFYRFHISESVETELVHSEFVSKGVE